MKPYVQETWPLWNRPGAQVWVWASIDPRGFRDRDLRSRLGVHQGAVSAGIAGSLRESVAGMGAAHARWHAAEVRRQRDWYRHRERLKEQRRWLRARAQVPPGPCHYCGSPDARHVDHVIPLCQGGTHDLVNLVRACGSCNSAKGPRTPEQWRRGDSPRLFRRTATAGPAATPRS